MSGPPAGIIILIITIILFIWESNTQLFSTGVLATASDPQSPGLILVFLPISTIQ